MKVFSIIAALIVPAVLAAQVCNLNTSTSCLYDWTNCGYCDDIGSVEGCNQRGTVHLTIDDGPFEYWTTVLDILKWKQVSATFMIVGQQVNGANKPYNAAQIMQRIVDEGHAMGCHSYTHPHMNTMTAEQMNTEISECLAAVKAATVGAKYPNGFTPKMFRPPYGECNTICMQQLAQYNLTATYWNFDTNDWQDNMTIIEHAIDNMVAPPSGNTPVDHSILGVCPTNAPGLIMLMHLQDDMGICALPGIIDRMRFKGWNFVNGDQCYGDASRSSTPIPVTVPAPSTNTAWPVPQCTTAGPVPTIPVNGCSTNNGGCATTGGVCTSSDSGTVTCSCASGYSGDGHTCTDTNECATNNGGCDPNAQCTNNVAAAATCACKTGYTGDGHTCTSNTSTSSTGGNGGNGGASSSSSSSSSSTANNNNNGGDSGSSSSSTGSTSKIGDGSELSGASTLSVGLIATVVVPFVGQIFLAN